MKILIANDGSEFGTSAIDFAADVIAGRAGTEIKVVTVIEPASTLEVDTVIESVEELTDPANPEASRAERVGERSVRALRAKFGGESVALSHEILAGPAARVIVEKAADWGADLIVVGSHGYTFWRKTMVGSVSERVTRHAPCSVLVVRPGKSD